MRVFVIVFLVSLTNLSANAGQTVVGISGENFLINGRLTYADIPGCLPAMYGLLFNVRAVNATFDDLEYGAGGLPAGMLDDPGNRPDNNYAGYGPWDPDANTDRFIAALPSWRAHGVLAVTLNFQGGCSCSRHGENGVTWAGDNQTPNNNPFGPNGVPIDPNYLDRMKRAIDALDANGMVCILGLFYFGQDQRISNANDSEALKAAVDAVVDWVLANDWRNVIIEVNNETTVGGYQHAILSPDRVHELFQRVKARGVRGGTRLYVSASSTGSNVPPNTWMAEADFFLPHGNGLNSSQIAQVVDAHRNHSAWQSNPRPICFNEDSTSIDNLNAAAAAHASWGLYDDRHHQSVWPANWVIWHPVTAAFFNRVAELVGLNSGDDTIWIPAATYTNKTFNGAMTSGTQYTSDTSSPPDADPLADSIVGQCIYADTDADSGTDWVEYTVEIPTTGTWYAWGRFYYPGAPGSDDPNSFWIRVDDGTEAIFGNEFRYQQWQWDGDSGIAEPEALRLGTIEAGTHRVRIRAREADRVIGPRLDMLLLTNNSRCIPSDAQTCQVSDPGPHIEIGGMVVVEAEHFTYKRPSGSGGREWYIADGVASTPTPDPDGFHAGASGGEYIECLQDERVTHDDPFTPGSFYDASIGGASVDYPITFATPGTYYPWLRVQSTGTEDNGAHITVNGALEPEGRRIQWCGGGWQWTNAQRDSGGTSCGINGTITINIPEAGTHLISLHQREDGAEIDKFILTNDAGYDPTSLGTGPPESPRTHPGIELNATAINRTVMVGHNLPNDTFTISNGEAGTLDYSITDNVEWLSVAPTSGDSTGETDTITIAYDVDELLSGTHAGVITIWAPGAFNSPQHVVVRITVEGPTIEISPQTFQRTTLFKQNLPDDTFNVRNSGPLALNYTITDNGDWLSVTPGSGSSTGEDDPISIHYSVAELAIGQHSATISINSPNAGNSPQTVAVDITVRTVAADFDQDGDVDQADFGHLQTCFTGPGMTNLPAGCENAMLDDDDDVDNADFGVWQACMSGSDRPVDPACE